MEDTRFGKSLLLSDHYSSFSDFCCIDKTLDNTRLSINNIYRFLYKIDRYNNTSSYENIIFPYIFKDSDTPFHEKNLKFFDYDKLLLDTDNHVDVSKRYNDIKKMLHSLAGHGYFMFKYKHKDRLLKINLGRIRRLITLEEQVDSLEPQYSLNNVTKVENLMCLVTNGSYKEVVTKEGREYFENDYTHTFTSKLSYFNLDCFKLYISLDLITNPFYKNVWKKVEECFVSKIYKAGISIEILEPGRIEDRLYPNKSSMKDFIDFSKFSSSSREYVQKLCEKHFQERSEVSK